VTPWAGSRGLRDLPTELIARIVEAWAATVDVPTLLYRTQS